MITLTLRLTSSLRCEAWGSGQLRVFFPALPMLYTLMVKSTSVWSWLMLSRLVNEYLPAAELICEADYQPILLQQVFS